MFSTPVHAVGPVNVTVTTAGGTSGPLGYTYDPNAVVVAPPVITSPTNGSTVTDDPPVINGTGGAGNTVTVTGDGNTVLCTAVVAADGTWSCTPGSAMGIGQHTISATQADSNGNVSAKSAPVTFTIASGTGTGVSNGSQNGSSGPAANGRLASTGSPLTGLAVIGLMLLLAGFGLAMGATRRRNRVVNNG